MLHGSFFDTPKDAHKSFQLPGAKPHYNPDRPGDVEHIFLDLALDISNRSYQGTCQIRLRPVRDGIDRLMLDAIGFAIDSVKVEGIPQDFSYDGEQLQVFLQPATESGKPITVEIVYHVEQPQRGIYFVGPSDRYPDKPVQVWTQGEDEDSRFWFPCFDYPGQLATSELRVRVPKPFLAISNGELIATEEVGEDIIYHWAQKQVHPSYLMTLAVGEFAEVRDRWNGTPVTYYTDKRREADIQRTMGKTPRAMEFFSKTFGYPYPYPKYAQVCVDDFIFGGMENTSTTLLTDRCLLDDRAALDNFNSESLVVHELAHQWFGDLVVIKHWSHAWLKEGMASYSEVLWTEFEYGAEDAAYYRLREARNYLTEDRSRYRRPIVTHIYREAIELYDRHLYEKGACVYHMLRAELGDELFFKTLQTFLTDNAHRTVETVDLLRAIEKATGRNLLFLFDQYVYRGGHPDYEVSYSWDADSNLAKVTVKQTQVKEDSDKNGGETYRFDLKLPIAFGYVREGSSDLKTPDLKTFTVRVSETEQSFYFPLETKPDFLSFDAGNHYLKTVKLNYPVPELKAQLKHDPDPISRIYAAKALAKKGSLEAVKALAEALTGDRFWGVRAEVAKQLAEVKLDQAFEALCQGLQDPEARVRRAVLSALGKFKTDASYGAIAQQLQQGDPSYYVEAEAAEALGKVTLPEQETETIDLLKTVLASRAGWNEVVRSGAIAGLSHLTTAEAALNAILPYTDLGVPQALRLSAIRALGAVSTGQTPANVERILDRYAQLSGETFFLTQVSLARGLGQMQTPQAIALLQTLADQTPDGRVRRIAEENIQKVQENVGSDKTLKQMREELDRLKKQNQELKSRLENLEAKAR